MSIAIRAVGTIVHGTVDAAPSYPAGIVAGDAVFLGAAWKDETATAPTLTGFTKVVDQVIGTGVDGAGTGQQRLVVYRKDTVTGSESGSVTVTPSGSVNVVSACFIVWSKTEASWDIVYDYGDDNTNATNLSADSQTTIPLTTDDVMLVCATHTANSNMGSSTVNTTGITYGSAVEHADTGTSNGNDQRFSWISRPVTAGTASSVTTFTSTIAVATNGGVAFIRLRETAGSLINGFKVWNGSSWVVKPVKVWNGSSWAAKPLKRWNGSAWVPVEY